MAENIDKKKKKMLLSPDLPYQDSTKCRHSARFRPFPASAHPGLGGSQSPGRPVLLSIWQNPRPGMVDWRSLSSPPGPALAHPGSAGGGEQLVPPQRAPAPQCLAQASTWQPCRASTWWPGWASLLPGEQVL